MDLFHNINTRYQQNIFVNNPKYLNTIDILVDKYYSQEIPYFSIITPIYNQEEIIIDNLNSILYKTTEKLYEIILICDACSDNTEKKVSEWFSNINSESQLLTRVLILKSSQPLFETSADNLGFYCSRGKYLLEIQADMNITDNGYNMRLLQPFLNNKNIIGISGRCCHNFSQSSGYGKLGSSIQNTIQELKIDKNYYYVSNTCNRGPLLIDGEKLKELGYLDEENYFLDDSDHDLFARAFSLKGWICGYVPIDVSSPLANGSTRKPRDKLNIEAYSIRQNKSSNGFLQKYRNLLADKQVTRVLIN